MVLQFSATKASVDEKAGLVNCLKPDPTSVVYGGQPLGSHSRSTDCCTWKQLKAVLPSNDLDFLTQTLRGHLQLIVQVVMVRLFLDQSRGLRFHEVLENERPCQS